MVWEIWEYGTRSLNQWLQQEHQWTWSSISESINHFTVLLHVFLMCSCVAPLYVYIGHHISSLLDNCFTTNWSKRLEFEKHEIELNPETTAAKPPLLKSNVAFRYKELADATAGFNKKNLIGVGGFANVHSNLPPCFASGTWMRNILQLSTGRDCYGWIACL